LSNQPAGLSLDSPRSVLFSKNGQADRKEGTKKADDTRDSVSHEHKTGRNPMGIVQTDKELQESVEGGPEGGGIYSRERNGRATMPFGSFVTTASAAQ